MHLKNYVLITVCVTMTTVSPAPSQNFDEQFTVKFFFWFSLYTFTGQGQRGRTSPFSRSESCPAGET